MWKIFQIFVYKSFKIVFPFVIFNLIGIIIDLDKIAEVFSPQLNPEIGTENMSG